MYKESLENIKKSRCRNIFIAD